MAGTGIGSTDNVLVCRQPVGNWYCIVVLPPVSAEIMPLVSTMVATEMVLLLHNPFFVASCMVSCTPGQVTDGPVIGSGNGFTITFVNTGQPGCMVYTISTVSANTPVTT